MTTITVHLLKPSKHTTIVYQGELLVHEPDHLLIHARWERPTLDLGYTQFATGDHFYEHYYTERWYNIFEIHSENGALKGWYCNVTRPAQLEGDLLRSEDLELDLFVSPDRTRLLQLDLDEFEARGFASSDPATYHAALAALDELEHMARAGAAPFSGLNG